MRHLLTRLLPALAFLALLALSGTVEAQSPLARAPEAAPVAAEGGLTGWISETQQNLHRQLAGAVRAVDESGARALFALLMLGFGYGVVHAAGPGHGKALISAYVVADASRARRAVGLSVLAATMQGVTAVAIVLVLAVALNAAGIEISRTSGLLARASYLLVAAAGVWLLWRSLRRILAHLRAPMTAHAPGHHHHHAHAHHDHAHGPDCGCSHTVPLERIGTSWRRDLGLALSVGLRPCSGALIVLVFALAQGLLTAGIATTFAMAAGTAVTVSAIALAALGGKLALLRLVPRGRSAELTLDGLAVAGALLLIAFAALLMAAPQPALF